MNLSTARAINNYAQKTPLIWIGKATGDQFGQTADFAIDGDNLSYYLQGNADGTEWWVAHFVYGGAAATGSTKKEAVMNFAKKLTWLPEKAKKRKLAAKIVEKYGAGPVVTKEGQTWVARLNGEVVGKADNYTAAMNIGNRVEKTKRR